MCAYYLGRRNAKIISQFFIFAQFCSTIIYTSVSKWRSLTLAWQFVGHILKTFGIVDLPVVDEQTGKIDEKSALAWKCRSICMFCLFFIVLPFNLQKNLSTLRYFSMVILCIVFITISVSLA